MLNQVPEAETEDGEASSSPPMMVKTALALSENMDRDAESIAQLENQLTSKQDYLIKLERFHVNLQKSNAKIRAELDDLNDHENYISSQDGSIRNRCKNVDETVRTLYGEAHVLEHRLDCINAQADDVEKSQKEDLERLEKELHYLEELEVQVNERRKCKMDKIKEKEQSLERENIELKAQLKTFTEMEFLAVDGDDVCNIEDLQGEIEGLRAKLEILEKDHGVLSEKLKEYDYQEEKLQKEFSDSAYNELEKRFDEINSDVLQLSETIRNENIVQQELLKSIQNLEECDQKFTVELVKTQKFMDELQQNRHDELSKLDEQIETTLKCCDEKSVKYASILEEINKNTQVLQSKEKLLEESAEVVKNLRNELEKLQICSDSQETLMLTNQNEETKFKLDALVAEKTSIEKQIATDELHLEDVIKKLRLLKSRIESDINNLTTTLNVEREKMKELDEADGKLTDLEVRKKSAEMEIKSLEQNRDALQNEFKEFQKKAATLEVTIEKEKRRFAVPSPVGIPKTCFATLAPKKADNPKIKRNWNSDSSVEEVPMSKLTKKRKNKKRFEPTKEL